MDQFEVSIRLQEEELIQAIIDYQDLSDVELGVAKQVLGKGEQSLKGKQIAVWDSVKSLYFKPDCPRCGAEIPLSEVVGSWDNGGRCSWCAKMESNDD